MRISLTQDALLVEMINFMAKITSDKGITVCLVSANTVAVGTSASYSTGINICI